MPELSTRRINWAKLPAILLLVGSMWVLYSLFSDARFRVTEVQIGGTRLLRRSDVERVVNVVNTSIFHVGTRRLEARLEREFGCIGHAAVTCRLPNRVSVTIAEQEVNLVWESGGRFWWVGNDGQVLGAADGPGDLLVVHDLGGYAPEPQGRIAGVPWTHALELRQAWPAMKSFDYTREKGLIVYCATPSQWPVYLGFQGSAAEKVAILKSLIEMLSAKGADVEYIDLRNERRPTFKKR
jgi:cell division septal protein FtsQ